MKKQLITIAAIGSLVLLSLITGYSLQAQQPEIFQSYPDESLEETLNERFSFTVSLMRLEQIKSALDSFKTLTEKGKARLGDRLINQVGNTDWETQNLGFANWVGSLEGTLRKQNTDIKKLEFELAKKQFEDQEITIDVVIQKEIESKQAEQDFQIFLNSFRIAD